MKIDIGSGKLIKSIEWVSLDPIHGKNEWKRLAQQTPWPTATNSIEELNASHVMEHIPAGNDRLAVMNEAHRVLMPGGTFTIVVPIMDGTWPAIADPTHVSFWVPESFKYFDHTLSASADYGILRWETESIAVTGYECRWVGKKP